MQRTMILAILALLFAGCAGSAGNIENYDFSQLRRAALLPIHPDAGIDPEFSIWTSREMERALKDRGAFKLLGHDTVKRIFDGMGKKPDPLTRGDDMVAFGKAVEADYVFRGVLEMFLEERSGQDLYGRTQGAAIQLELVYAPLDSVIWRVKEYTSQNQPMTTYRSAILYCIDAIMKRIDENLRGTAM